MGENNKGDKLKVEILRVAVHFQTIFSLVLKGDSIA